MTSSACGPRCTTRPLSTTMTSSAASRGGQPVRDRHRGPAAGHRVQRPLQPHLGGRVDRAGRLVEHQQVRVGDVGAGQRDQLPLPDRQRLAALADPGLQARPAGRRPSRPGPSSRERRARCRSSVRSGRRTGRCRRPSRRTGSRPAAPSRPARAATSKLTSVQRHAGQQHLAAATGPSAG